MKKVSQNIFNQLASLLSGIPIKPGIYTRRIYLIEVAFTVPLEYSTSSSKMKALDFSVFLSFYRSVAKGLVLLPLHSE